MTLRFAAVRFGTKRWLSAALLGFALLGLATPGFATVIVATDASWRVTASAPGSGWNDDAMFDDSGWELATVLYDVGDFIPGLVAQGIWSSGGQFSTTETQMWTRQVVHLSVLPTSAQLTSGFDDDGDLYVNGFLVVSDHNGFANNSFADVTSYLTLGDNWIAFTATDNYPVWGYQHSAWAQIEGTFAGVPEPTSLALMALGLGAMHFVRRRRS